MTTNDRDFHGRAVGETFDRIAEHFSATRTHPWPSVTSFLAEAEGGDIGLAVGIGNGRHGEPLSKQVSKVVGVDASPRLLTIARERANHEYSLHPVVGDANDLPIAADIVDLALYIATIHHLAPRQRRIASLNELARVLRSNGTALVSAWSTEHDRFDTSTGFDTMIDWTLPDGTAIPRFYHIYDPDEFAADMAESDLTVLKTSVNNGNCYAEVKG